MENEISTEPVRQEENTAPVSAEQQENAQPAEQETAVQPENVSSEETVRTRPEPIPVTEEMVEKTRKTLATMLDYLALDGTVKAEGKPGKINLLIASDDAGRIIGRKGQSLESLQILLNRMMQKGDEPFPKIYIDIDGYSSNSKRGDKRSEGGRRPPRGERRGRGGRDDERRDFVPRGASDKDEQLRQQALDSAKEVRRWGESVTLPPMNSHDRRIIHITLENEKDLQTESAGDGNFKSVVISLKKEEAN